MKVQILMNDDIVKRIDTLADKLGTNRSAICLSIIAKALPDWEEIVKEN